MRYPVLLLCLMVSTLFAADRPNIVIILADDYGYGSSGCYGADGNLVRTPNIDRLAKEGRRFTDANTTSVFPTTQNDGSAPLRRIQGATTLLNRPIGVLIAPSI